MEQNRRGENMKWYPIHVKSKQLILDLYISQSFIQFPEAYFQVHIMEDDSIHAFWRTPLSRDVLTQVMSNVRVSLDGVTEIFQTKEYYNEIEKASPIQSAVMSNDEAQVILKLFHDGLPEFYCDISGYDGHEYVLTIYGNYPQKLEFWCYVRPELAKVVEVINILIKKANLDAKFYGVRISDDD